MNGMDYWNGGAQFYLLILDCGSCGSQQYNSLMIMLGSVLARMDLSFRKQSEDQVFEFSFPEEV